MTHSLPLTCAITLPLPTPVLNHLFAPYLCQQSGLRICPLVPCSSALLHQLVPAMQRVAVAVLHPELGAGGQYIPAAANCCQPGRLRSCQLSRNARLLLLGDTRKCIDQDC